MNRPFLVVASLLACLACSRPTPLAPGLSDSTYVQVMAALRQLPLGAAAVGVNRDRARDSILRVFNVSAASLDTAAVILSFDPQRAGNLWRAVEKHTGATKPPK